MMSIVLAYIVYGNAFWRGIGMVLTPIPGFLRWISPSCYRPDQFSILDGHRFTTSSACNNFTHPVGICHQCVITKAQQPGGRDHDIYRGIVNVLISPLGLLDVQSLVSVLARLAFGLPKLCYG